MLRSYNVHVSKNRGTFSRFPELHWVASSMIYAFYPTPFFQLGVYLSREVGGRIPTFDLLCKKLKILLFYGDRHWERWIFSDVGFFLDDGFILVLGNWEWKCTFQLRNIAHLMNRYAWCE